VRDEIRSISTVIELRELLKGKVGAFRTGDTYPVITSDPRDSVESKYLKIHSEFWLNRSLKTLVIN
jgi:hypothetical protein